MPSSSSVPPNVFSSTGRLRREHSRDYTSRSNKTWHLSEKSIPITCIDAVNFTTAEDAELKRLELAILFTIAYTFWVKNTSACHVINIKK